eukprot:m.149395 g.149395  ORF g.149395 m.149395 type:complete len:86 (-) comp10131_c0_seq8:1737-1994(-)
MAFLKKPFLPSSGATFWCVPGGGDSSSGSSGCGSGSSSGPLLLARLCTPLPLPRFFVVALSALVFLRFLYIINKPVSHQSLPRAS